MIKMYNNNLLIRPHTTEVVLGNGMSIIEQRGRKDLVWGYKINTEDSFDISKEKPTKLLLYPMYAADQITATLPGGEDSVEYHIVKQEDIILEVDC